MPTWNIKPNEPKKDLVATRCHVLRLLVNDKETKILAGTESNEGWVIGKKSRRDRFERGFRSGLKISQSHCATFEVLAPGYLLAIQHQGVPQPETILVQPYTGALHAGDRILLLDKETQEVKERVEVLAEPVPG